MTPGEIEVRDMAQRSRPAIRIERDEGVFQATRRADGRWRVHLKLVSADVDAAERMRQLAFEELMGLER